jgi:trimeric autotransporter adhesin
MTSNNQVSPVIRISRGERDASARATHLKAASKKYLETTIERKQMSTTTNFKRIALVAVAALGLGVLSSVPSQAVAQGDTLVSTAGTATIGGTVVSDSGTATSFTFSFLTSATAGGDTYTVVPTLKSAPTGNTALPIVVLETWTASTLVDTDTAGNGVQTAPQYQSYAMGSSIYIANATSGASAAVSPRATFRLLFANSGQIAGTYVVTLRSTPSVTGSSDNVPDTGTDISVVVSAPVRTASPAYSTAIMSVASSSPAWQATATDSAVTALSTGSTTAAAAIRVALRNASNTATNVGESVTVTTTGGVVGLSAAGAKGRSMTFAYGFGASEIDVFVFPDGSSGKATVSISTPSVTFAAKTVNFYSDVTNSITAAAYTSVIGTTSTEGVWGTQLDAAGTSFGASTLLYAYSSDTTTISNNGTACTWNSTLSVAVCNLTGVKDGTANITLRDASTVALSTKVSPAVAVRVTTKPAASVKLAFDKPSYAPGQAGTLLVSVLDADGKVMPAGTYNPLFTAGISYNLTTGARISGVETNTSVAIAANPVASAANPIVSLDPVAQYSFYMPATGGTLTATAKGGTALVAAGQVTVTASATLTDSGAAALAAVTALSTTVASLRTLIVTLTNLVLKIQKKVRA